jgi:hypothetical protein
MAEWDNKEEFLAMLEAGMAEDAKKTPEWFAAQGAKVEGEKAVFFRRALHQLVKTWYPERGSMFGSNPMFWSTYPEAKDAILMDMVCPIVCRGRLNGDENWHQLCLDKVNKMMEVM